MWTMLALMFGLATKNTPWPLSYLPRLLENGMKRSFLDVEFEKSFKYLEAELGDEEWFNGKEFGRSDVMLSYPLEQIIQNGWYDLEKEYPKLSAWRNRILETPSWKRGIEKGNGFDLRF